MTGNVYAKLGPRFEQAVAFANRVHAGQARKDTGAPYIAHLLGVTALVLEDGGTEEEAIAAMLHDAAEDGAGEETLTQIREQFGEKIAAIVAECSDTFENPKPPWRPRKEAHLAHLKTASPEATHIMMADKVYNSRSLLRGLRHNGEEVWAQFSGGKEGSIWYFKEMLSIFRTIHRGYLIDEFARVIAAIEHIIAQT